MCCCSTGYTGDCWLFFKISGFILLKFRKLINISILFKILKLIHAHVSEELVLFFPLAINSLYTLRWCYFFLKNALLTIIFQ